MNLFSNELAEHITRCVAMVDGRNNGGEIGSGFFVDSDLLLTCAHVAGTGPGDVVIDQFGDRRATGTVEASVPVADGDLALVRVTHADGTPPQPAVLLGAGSLETGTAFAPGFPTFWGSAKQRVFGQYELVELQVSKKVDPATGLVSLAKLEGEVEDGLSGSALISYPAGEVVGIVQYRRPSAVGVTGGGAIPMQVAMTRLPALAPLVENPPGSAFMWTTLVRSAAEVMRFRRPRIDLAFSGDACRWGVGETSDEPLQDVTIDAFGDTVGRAVFAWLSRRRPQTADELRWSGELLGIALLAGGSGKRVMEQHAFGAPFDLRIAFKAASELQDAPWELALIGKSGEGLATRPSTSFTRVDMTAVAGAPQPLVDSLRVVALGPHGGKIANAPDPIPSTEPLSRISFERRKPKIMFADALNLTTASGVAPHIVHYAGYARMTIAGQAELLIQTDGEEPQPLSNLAAACVAAGVRILLVQSRAPRMRLEWGPPPPPSAFDGLLGGDLRAIVFTQFGVSDRLLRAFNVELYRRLDQGATVEAAVQHARGQLKQYYDKTEPGAFGAFVVITGPEGGPALLSSREVEAPTGRSQAAGRDVTTKALHGAPP